MELRPVDLPILRSEAYEVARRHSAVYFEQGIRDGNRQSRPALPPSEAADVLAFEEAERLNAADLYFVSKDMTRLAIAAAESLPVFNLMPEDMPAGWGLVYFDAPVANPVRLDDHGGVATPIVAATWGPSPNWAPASKRGIWVTWYSDRNAVLAQLEGRIRGSSMAYLRQTTARIQTDDDFQVPFSADAQQILRDGQPIDFSQAQGLARWFAVLKAMWLLMAQPMATVQEVEYDRTTRRRIARLGKEPPPVRVVSLRRSPSDRGDGESDREYHHQWIVKGHWRQQWYPSRGVHRPAWIAPHIKGPEGAPLIGGEKVYAWTR